MIAGLEEKEAMDAEGLEAFIADGNRNRTTHATESNDQSSRWVRARALRERPPVRPSALACRVDCIGGGDACGTVGSHSSAAVVNGTVCRHSSAAVNN